MNETRVQHLKDDGDDVADKDFFGIITINGAGRRGSTQIQQMKKENNNHDYDLASPMRWRRRINK